MRTRILEGAELAVLAEVPDGPFYRRHDVVAQLGDAQVVVLEAMVGEVPTIVAYWPIWVAVHLEPLWIAPAARRQPAAARALVEAMRAQLQVQGITTAFAVIGHEDLVTHLPMAARLGFERVPGDLFFIRGDAQHGSSGGTGDQSGGPVLHEPGREQARPGRRQHRDDGPPELGD